MVWFCVDSVIPESNLRLMNLRAPKLGAILLLTTTLCGSSRAAEIEKGSPRCSTARIWPCAWQIVTSGCGARTQQPCCCQELLGESCRKAPLPVP